MGYLYDLYIYIYSIYIVCLTVSLHCTDITGQSHLMRQVHKHIVCIERNFMFNISSMYSYNGTPLVKKQRLSVQLPMQTKEETKDNPVL